MDDTWADLEKLLDGRTLGVYAGRPFWVQTEGDTGSVDLTINETSDLTNVFALDLIEPDDECAYCDDRLAEIDDLKEGIAELRSRINNARRALVAGVLGSDVRISRARHALNGHSTE